MNRFKLVSLSFMLCLSVGMFHCPADVEPDTDSSSDSSTNPDGGGSGGGSGGGNGGGSDSLSVDDIGLSWSTWGAGNQPLPDAITCSTSGDATSATITMGGDGLTPIEYDLNDSGTGGDATAGDGVFSIEFEQDLGVNALWAVDNIGHYITCEAENSSGDTEEYVWNTAGQVVVENDTSSTNFDALFIARPSASTWGGDLVSGLITPGSNHTVTDVPCGVWDMRIESTGGGSAEIYNKVVSCGGSYSWILE